MHFFKIIVNQISNKGLHKLIQPSSVTHKCSLCQQSCGWPSPICSYCEDHIPWNLHPCYQCAHPLTDTLVDCRYCVNEAPWDNCYSATLYEYPVVQCLHQLKVQLQQGTAYSLAFLFSRYLRSRCQGTFPDAIIPIPSRPGALAQRGFNPVALIAQNLAIELNLPLNTKLLVANTHDAQKDKTRQQRLANQERFKITRRPPAHCVVIDDVMTTGATLSCATKILKRYGAQQVDVWTISRTPNKGWYG